MLGRRSGIRLRCRAAAAARSTLERRASMARATRSPTSWTNSTSPVLEPAGRHRPDVQHPDDPALDHEGHADERLDALFPQDGVEHVGVVDVLDDDRRDLGGDAAREALAHRDAHPLPHLLLDAARGRCDQVAGRVVEQQHGGRVDIEDLAHRVRAARRAGPGTSRWVRAASVTDSMRRSRSVSSSCASPRAATSASVASGLSSIGSPSAGRPVTATRPDEATVRAPRRSDHAGRGPAPGGTGPGVRTGTTAKATASPSGRSRPLGYPTGRMPNRFWCRSVSRGIRIGVR